MFGLAIGLMLGGKFRRVEGVWEAHSQPIAYVLARIPMPAAAMTLGHVVLGRTAADLSRTRVHERVHVRQYERWGPFFLPAYLGVAGWLYVTGRDGYRQNPFEIEAYASELGK